MTPTPLRLAARDALALTELHADPDRLRRPVRRRGSDFIDIGWDEAIAESADRLKAVQGAHGRHSVAYYFGNPSGHKAPFILYGPLLMEALGSMQVYSPGTAAAGCPAGRGFRRTQGNWWASA